MIIGVPKSQRSVTPVGLHDTVLEQCRFSAPSRLFAMPDYGREQLKLFGSSIEPEPLYCVVLG